MNVLKHGILNFMIAAIAFSFFKIPILSTEMLLVIVGSMAIDLDHLLSDYKSLRNPGKMIKRWIKNQDKFTGRLYLFHTYEFFLLIAILAFFYNWVLFMLFGMILHFLEDGYINIRYTKDVQWMGSYSLILRFIRNL